MDTAFDAPFDEVLTGEHDGVPVAGAGHHDENHGHHHDQHHGHHHDQHHDENHPRHARAARARRRWRRLVARTRAVRARVRRTPAGRLSWRIGVGVLGGVLLVAGVVMIPGPGQGWATVFLALAILSTEFRWAHRIRHGLWVRLIAARKAYSHSTRGRKAALAALTVTVSVVALALVLWGSLAVTGLPGWTPAPVADLVGGLPGVQ